MAPWHLARSKALSIGLSNAHFKSLGLPSLIEARSATSRTAVYGPVRTVVWEGRRRETPPYPDHRRNLAAAARSRERPLTEPTAGAQPWLRRARAPALTAWLNEKGSDPTWGEDETNEF